ncbi:MAG TPA: vitamin K epoxide reductase family protein [Polyangia bacterium]|nr:vitamin K epoxide reductase family protein [Polyangia bacterium]
MRRVGVATLAAAGIADSLYMLAYHGGLLRSLRCPFFGEGCNKVGRSAHAVHFGVPNAAAGAVAYAGMAATALWAGSHPLDERPWQPLGIGALATVAGAASAFLTWEQPTKVGAWCFWCLSSAAINAAIFALAIGDASKAARVIATRRRQR